MLFSTPAIPREVCFVCWLWAFQVPCGTGRTLDVWPFASLALPLLAIWVLLLFMPLCFGLYRGCLGGSTPEWTEKENTERKHTCLENKYVNTERIHMCWTFATHDFKDIALNPRPLLKGNPGSYILGPKIYTFGRGGQICIFCSFCCGHPSITKLQFPGKCYFWGTIFLFPGKFKICLFNKFRLRFWYELGAQGGLPPERLQMISSQSNPTYVFIGCSLAAQER